MAKVINLMGYKVLTLAVKAEFFNAIKLGEKIEEYREVKPYWDKRLLDRNYTHVQITNGYPKKGDVSRRLIFNYIGYEIKTITHPHFGNKPTRVYAIKLVKGGE